MKIKLVFVLLLISLLSGCDFKLRAQPALSENLGYIYLQEQTPSNALTYYLRQRLLLAGAKLSAVPNQGSTTLQLSPPVLKKTKLNTNVDIQTRLYTFTYSTEMTLIFATPHNKKQMSNKTFNTSHNLVVNADSTLDATGQLDTAIEEMQNEIVSKILAYLQAQSRLNLRNF